MQLYDCYLRQIVDNIENMLSETNHRQATSLIIRKFLDVKPCRKCFFGSAFKDDNAYALFISDFYQFV